MPHLSLDAAQAGAFQLLGKSWCSVRMNEQKVNTETLHDVATDIVKPEYTV